MSDQETKERWHILVIGAILIPGLLIALYASGRYDAENVTAHGLLIGVIGSAMFAAAPKSDGRRRIIAGMFGWIIIAIIAALLLVSIVQNFEQTIRAITTGAPWLFDKVSGLRES